ncbi:hypothetical protein QEH59_04070 [Coraliomargarita sp. SDUM461004]|uniref:Uncharacterized protein n=1 Tax=Thalassobacterium sedimentorum TaxID=3041258 RepID=A0ABU1AFJ1_9BACT|nr:hypothetical protein [Coraliomargarita sp. SDUM461004]
MPVNAQRAGGARDQQSVRVMDRIDAQEGAQRLEAFRQQRLEGDFCFDFELAHKPRRARTVRYQGRMWGTWNEVGPITRFSVQPAEGDAEAVVELIIQNGEHPQVWMRRSQQAAFELLQGVALFEPILPGLLYSPFDLQMPFVYWDDFIYEGPTLVGATRVAQQFLMQPPEASASAERGIVGVRVGLDDTYNALWRIEVIGADGEATSRFAVESFQKVQEQYIVKRITLTDYPSKDRTTFDVKAAAVGVALDRYLFAPESTRSVDELRPLRMEDL